MASNFFFKRSVDAPDQAGGLGLDSSAEIIDDTPEGSPLLARAKSFPKRTSDSGICFLFVTMR